MAQLFQDRLVARGYRVFLDLNGMCAGRFPKQLMGRIDECRDFIAILSARSLQLRDDEDDDWFRKEIAYALKQRKNIVPVYLWDFNKADLKTLPEDVSALAEYQGVEAIHHYMASVIDCMTGMFLSKRKFSLGRIFKKYYRELLIFAMAIVIGVVYSDLRQMRAELRQSRISVAGSSMSGNSSLLSMANASLRLATKAGGAIEVEGGYK